MRRPHQTRRVVDSAVLQLLFLQPPQLGERSLAVTLDPVPERGPRGWVIALVAVGAAVAAVAVGVGVRQARDEGTQIAPETERVLRIE